MNNTNRGVIYGINEMLKSINILLNAMGSCEAEKASGDYDNVQNPEYGESEEALNRASELIADAIGFLETMIPPKVDFKHNLASEIRYAYADLLK